MRQRVTSKSKPPTPETPAQIESVVSGLLKWFAVAARDLPWRRTQNPYAIWVSEVMLQQTQVKTVIPYWERWMRALPTVQKLALADSQTVHKLWEGLGYYSRARNLHRAAGLILTDHGGKFPEDAAHISALPGIGPYTAGAIRSIAFNHPAPVVDGNVARVLSRVFLIPGDPRDSKTSARLWEIAGQLVRTAKLHPGRACSACNQALMELGALVCTPSMPRCVCCPLQTLCEASRSARQSEFPQLKPRERPTARRFVAVVAQRDQKYLVRQRPAGVVNGNLWEFPNVEVNPATRPGYAVRKILGRPAQELEPLCIIRHSITRYRITLEVVQTRLQFNGCEGRWLTWSQLQELPFASAHKKILQKLPSEQTSPRPTPPCKKS